MVKRTREEWETMLSSKEKVRVARERHAKAAEARSIPPPSTSPSSGSKGQAKVDGDVDERQAKAAEPRCIPPPSTSSSSGSKGQAKGDGDVDGDGQTKGYGKVKDSGVTKGDGKAKDGGSQTKGDGKVTCGGGQAKGDDGQAKGDGKSKEGGMIKGDGKAKDGGVTKGAKDGGKTKLACKSKWGGKNKFVDKGLNFGKDGGKTKGADKGDSKSMPGGKTNAAVGDGKGVSNLQAEDGGKAKDSGIGKGVGKHMDANAAQLSATMRERLQREWSAHRAQMLFIAELYQNIEESDVARIGN